MKFRFLMTAFFLNFIIIPCFAQSFKTATDELAALLGSYQTYQADFKQTLLSGSDRDFSLGSLYMQRPGRFRWEVHQPNRQIIIANQNTLWVYDVELEQVTQEKIDSHSSTNPATLLSGDASQLIKNYDVKKIERSDGVWYQLKPYDPEASFILVRMRFDKNRLTSIWVKNNLGQISVFQFFEIRVNKTLPKTLFLFKVPSGVNILQ